MLNLAYNALWDGRALENLELWRQDEAYLDLLGAQRIPETTAGDFCRRFTPAPTCKRCTRPTTWPRRQSSIVGRPPGDVRFVFGLDLPLGQHVEAEFGLEIAQKAAENPATDPAAGSARAGQAADWRRVAFKTCDWSTKKWPSGPVGRRPAVPAAAPGGPAQ